MITIVRFYLSYDLLTAILSPSISVYSNENCIVVTDVVIMLLVSVMYRVVLTLFMTLSTE